MYVNEILTKIENISVYGINPLKDFVFYSKKIFNSWY
jgi:hypothetical protein